MTHKTNIPDIERVFYVSGSGDNAQTGKSPEVPKRTINSTVIVLPAATLTDPVWIHGDGVLTGFTFVDGLVCFLDAVVGNVVANDDCGLNCKLLDGNIVVNVGGTLFCIIEVHTGTITNNGTINGLINGVPFGTYQQKHEEQVVLNAFSPNTQAPVATDTLLQIEFGAAQFGPTDPVQLSVLGAVTINQSDQYNLKLVLQYGRSGAAGSSAIVFFRILIDGVQFGPSRYSQLDNPNQAFPVQFSIPIDLVATQVLTVEFWRDSAGFNAGELMPRTPTLVGPNPSPSAAIILTRNRLVQPV